MALRKVTFSQGGKVIGSRTRDTSTGKIVSSTRKKSSGGSSKSKPTYVVRDTKTGEVIRIGTVGEGIAEAQLQTRAAQVKSTIKPTTVSATQQAQRQIQGFQTTVDIEQLKQAKRAAEIKFQKERQQLINQQVEQQKKAQQIITSSTQPSLINLINQGFNNQQANLILQQWETTRGIEGLRNLDVSKFFQKLNDRGVVVDQTSQVQAFKIGVNQELVRNFEKPLAFTEPASKFQKALKDLEKKKEAFETKPLAGAKESIKAQLNSLENKYVTKQSLTPQEQARYLFLVKKQNANLTQAQLDLLVSVIKSPVTYGKNLKIRYDKGENALYNDILSFSKGIGIGLKEIFIDPVTGAFNYGRNLRKRFEQGENNPLYKDIKRVTKGIKNISGFVKNNPVESALIVGIAVEQGLKLTAKEYKKNPAESLGKAIAFFFPGQVLKIGGKAIGFTVKSIANIDKLFTVMPKATFLKVNKILKNVKLSSKVKIDRIYRILNKDIDIFKITKSKFNKLKLARLERLAKKYDSKPLAKFKVGTKREILSDKKAKLIKRLVELSNLPKQYTKSKLNKFKLDRLERLAKKYDSKPLAKFKVGTKREILSDKKAKLIEKISKALEIPKNKLKQLELKRLNNLAKQIDKKPLATFQIDKPLPKNIKTRFANKKAQAGLRRQTQVQVNKLEDQTQKVMQEALKLKEGQRIQAGEIIRFKTGEQLESITFTIGNIQENKLLNIAKKLRTTLLNLRTLRALKILNNIDKLYLGIARLLVKLEFSRDYLKAYDNLRINLRAPIDLDKFRTRFVDKFKDKTIYEDLRIPKKIIIDEIKKIQVPIDKTIDKAITRAKIKLKETPIKPKKIPKIKLSFDSKELDNKLATFTGTYVERRDPRKNYNPKTNPRVVKSYKLTTTKNRLLKFLAEKTDKNLARSISNPQVLGIGKKKKDIPKPKVLNKFKKTKSGYLEKPKAALDSRAEKGEIKRLRALKQPKRKKVTKSTKKTKKSSKIKPNKQKKTKQ